MDVIGVDVLLRPKRRSAARQALERKAVARIDSRHAQDHDLDLVALAPLIERPLGVEAPHGALGLRVGRAGLVDPFARTIAVYPARGKVHESPWYHGAAPARRERCKQSTHTGIARSACGG